MWRAAPALERLGPLTDQIVVVDDQSGLVAAGREVVATGAGGLEQLERCDVVIKSPGISRYREDVVGLENADVAVVGGVGLSIHELDRSKVVCVTGTKGKSTTASVLGHLLEGLGVRSEVTGNIGRPPFAAGLTDELDVLVIETSSFQALDVADAPGLVAVTSLAVDHVDWHGSAERYWEDKLSLTSLPGAGTTVAQARSRCSRACRAPRWRGGLGRRAGRGLGRAPGPGGRAQPGQRLGGPLDPRRPRRGGGRRRRGPAPGGRRLRRAARAAQPGGHQGSDAFFIDDSLATNVLPTLAALASFPDEPLAILLGGYDRGVDYDELIGALADRAAPPW